MRWKLLILFALIGIGLIVTGVYLMKPELATSLTSKLFQPRGVSEPSLIGQGGGGKITYEWQVSSKTGNEQYLDVEINPFNETQTEFIITTNDKTAYSNALSLSSKSISAVPISEVSKTSLDFNKGTLDLNTGGSSFIVNHKPLEDGMSLKVGWNSIVINSSTGNAAPFQYNYFDNVVITSDGNIHIAYGGGNQEFWYANSTDGGLIWSNTLINTVQNANRLTMLSNSTDGLFVSYEDNSGDDMMKQDSGDGGITWTTAIDISDGSPNAKPGTCAVDENDMVHCSMISSGTALYVNTTNFGTTTVINDNLNDDTDLMSMATGANGCYYLVGSGTDQDDLDIWSNCLNGLGDTNRIQIYDGVNVIRSSITVASNGDLWVAFEESENLWVANSSDGGFTWTTQEIDSLTSENPDIAINDLGDIHILYSSTTLLAVGSEMYWANSTDGGLTWNTRFVLPHDNSLSGSIVNSRYPASNRMTTQLRYVYSNESMAIFYNNFSIAETPSTEPNLTNTLIIPANINFITQVSKEDPFNVSVDVACTDFNCNGVNVSLISSGPTSANLAQLATNDTSVSSNDWLNRDASLNLTDGPASVTLNADQSAYLKVQNFSFDNIPDDGTLLGIEFEVIRNKTDAGTVLDSDTRLVLPDGSFSTANKNNLSGWQTGTAQNTFYGGPTDLWGESINITDIKDKDFGFAISVNISVATATAQIEYITAKIFYTSLIPPTTGNPFHINESTIHSNANPNITTLASGETTSVIWIVNATGDFGTNHTFYINSTQASNGSVSDSTDVWNVTITENIDNSPPLITILSPLEMTYPNSTVDFNISTHELSSSCELTLDGGVINRSLESSNFTFWFNNTVGALSDGAYLANFTCVDGWGNIGSAWNFFGIDANPPIISLLKPTPFDALNSTSVQFQYNASGGALDTCELWGDWDQTFGINQTTKVATDAAMEEFNATTPEGTFIWNVWCNSSIGNEDFSQQGNLTFSVAGFPEIEFQGDTPANGSTQSADSVFVNTTTISSLQEYSVMDFDNDLLLFMRMEEVSGKTVFGDSSYGHNGTLAGDGFIDENGQFGNGYQGDGSVDRIITTMVYSDVGAVNQTTACARIKTIATGVTDEPVSASSNIWRFQVRLGRLRVRSTDSAGSTGVLTGTTLVNDGEWHHICYSYNPSVTIDSKIYIDGRLDAESDEHATGRNLGNSNNDRTVNIGARGSSNGNSFDGSIDEVMIFNRTLNESEILTLNNSKTHEYGFNFEGLEERDYTFRGHVVDENGNRNDTGLRTVTIGAENPPPNVTDLIPLLNTVFNTTDEITISANITDDGTVGTGIFVNITLPDSTVDTLNLSQLGDPANYNVSYIIPNQLGNYQVRFIINDTLGALNSTEVTNFSVRENTPPNITSLIPTLNSVFNVSNEFEIGATMIDNLGTDAMFVNITRPDGVVDRLNLTNSTAEGSKYNISYTAPFITGNYDVRFIGNDTSNNINTTEVTNFTINDVTPPVLSNFAFLAINGSQELIGNESNFNSANLSLIEFTNLTFTVTDGSNISDDITIFFTANGTDACSLGNLQSESCISWTDYVEFRNQTATSTYDDTHEGTARGDSISCDWIGNTTFRNYTCQIDEHYNPNVFKWYDALYNFSLVKWQTGSTQRITKSNQIKVRINETLVPTIAEQYKLDIRVNYTTGAQLPASPLEAYACNSSYTTGDVQTSASCAFIAEKLPSEFGDVGTKFRAIFTNNTMQNITNIGWIVLRTDLNAPSRYYYIKTYNITSTTHVQQWEYSTSAGTTWTNLDDGFESELNVNWFHLTHDGHEGTQLIVKIRANDTFGNFGNSSDNVLNWDINASTNFRPLVDITAPLSFENVSQVVQINWTTVEPNMDSYFTNISVFNGSLTTSLVTEFPDQFVNFTWNTTGVSNGLYNITVLSYENETVDGLQGNDTHFNINVTNVIAGADNSPPSFTPVLGNQTQTYNVAFSYDMNATDETLFDSFAINDTVNFKVSQTGLLENNTVVTVGFYTINVTINDSSDNLNSTMLDIDITKETSAVNLTLNHIQSNITINNDTAIFLNGTLITGHTTGTLRMFNNGTIINEGTTPIFNDTTFIGVGLYNITLHYLSDQNYTFSSETFYVNVTAVVVAPDNQAPAFVPDLENQTFVYNTAFAYDMNATDDVLFGAFTINDSVNFKVSDSGLLENNSVVRVGLYTINVTINDSSNNLNSTMLDIDITRATPLLNLTLNGTQGNQTISNNTAIDLNGTSTGEGVISLYNNGSLINQGATPVYNDTTFIGVGEYNITLISEQTQNYTRASETFYVNVTVVVVAVDSTAPIFDPNLVNQTVTYNEPFAYDMNATDETLFGVFRINDSVNFKVSDTGLLENNTVLRVGLFTINVSINDSSDNQNSTMLDITVIKATGVVSQFIRESDSDQSATTFSNNTNATGVLDVGTGLIQMFLNGSIINNGTSPLANFTNHTGLGTFIYNTTYLGNENYTGASERWTLTIGIAAVGTCGTTFNQTRIIPTATLPYVKLCSTLEFI